MRLGYPWLVTPVRVPVVAVRSRRALAVVALLSALAGACSSSSGKGGGAGASGGSGASGGAGAGGAPGLCANGTFTPAGSLTCADTFDAQTANPSGIVGLITSGACGGSLVWLAQTLNYDFACVYDATTKMLTGALQYTDTGGRCTGAATKLPSECIRSVTYADGGTDGGAPAACSSGPLVERGDASCADNFSAQVTASHVASIEGSRFCGGYAVWLEKRPDNSVLTCVYDSTVAMNLLGARIETDTSDSCSGAATTLPEECSRFQTFAEPADAGAGCAGPLVMEGAVMCADTFDSQVANPAPHAPNQDFVASGACGGYLVWFNTGMLYDLTCIYDPTTKKLVGAHFQGDTPGSQCAGAGRDLSPSCSRREAFADAGAH
jgi:hypothetical protein